MSGASLDDLGLLLSGQVLANKRVNLTGRPGTRLAVSAPPHISSKGLGQGARPSRPAGYAQRYRALSPAVTGKMTIELTEALRDGRDKAGTSTLTTVQAPGPLFRDDSSPQHARGALP